MKTKIILDDVVIIRLFLILLLVIYHSFAPFTGDWYAFDEADYNNVYFWIGKTAYSFFLEMFVFISGMLAGLAKTPFDNAFIYKKFKRLIIPSVIFSIIYFLIFYEWNFLNFVINLITGCGHMWFLHMLFCCFIGIYIIRKFNINIYWALSISILLVLLSNGFLLFQIERVIYYFIYFILGYLIYYKNAKEILIKRGGWLYLVLYLITLPYAVESHFLILKLVNSFCGILMCYYVVQKYISKRNKPLPIYIYIYYQIIHLEFI